VEMENVGTEVAQKVQGLVAAKPCPAAIGNFKVGELVYQIRAPFPEWGAALRGEPVPALRMFAGKFKRLRCFLSGDDPELVASVYTDRGIKALATRVWDELPASTPGKEAKSFWGDGCFYIVRRNSVARFRAAEARLDIVVPGKRALSQVDIAIRFALTLLLSRGGGLVVHSAGLVHADKGILFFGVSGSGKSTMAAVAQADAILSDEAVIVQRREGRWFAYGTPYSGMLEHAGTNLKVELAALAKLSKAPSYELKRLSRQAAVRDLLKVTIVLDESCDNKRINTLNVLAMVGEVPVYELKFKPEPSVWPFVLEQLGHLASGDPR
jgi:hypothetical protein